MQTNIQNRKQDNTSENVSSKSMNIDVSQSADITADSYVPSSDISNDANQEQKVVAENGYVSDKPDTAQVCEEVGTPETLDIDCPTCRTSNHSKYFDEDGYFDYSATCRTACDQFSGGEDSPEKNDTGIISNQQENRSFDVDHTCPLSTQPDDQSSNYEKHFDDNYNMNFKVSENSIKDFQMNDTLQINPLDVSTNEISESRCNLIESQLENNEHDEQQTSDQKGNSLEEPAILTNNIDNLHKTMIYENSIEIGQPKCESLPIFKARDSRRISNSDDILMNGNLCFSLGGNTNKLNDVTLLPDVSSVSIKTVIDTCEKNHIPQNIEDEFISSGKSNHEEINTCKSADSAKSMQLINSLLQEKQSLEINMHKKKEVTFSNCESFEAKTNSIARAVVSRDVTSFPEQTFDTNIKPIITDEISSPVIENHSSTCNNMGSEINTHEQCLKSKDFIVTNSNMNVDNSNVSRRKRGGRKNRRRAKRDRANISKIAVSYFVHIPFLSISKAP